MATDRSSYLVEAHQRLGAKLVPFGGWNMPLSYPSGTMAEHLACRNDSAVFDVSHLGTVRVEGAHAKGLLQSAFTNDLDKIAPGRAQYTHLLNTEGSVVDDIIVWWVDEARFDVMPNASNTSSVRTAIGGVDVTESRVILAVQGPKAKERLARVCAAMADIKRFTVGRVVYGGVECIVAGTGYTGEAGVEISAPLEIAQQLWDEIVGAGITPAGLGARDTLRLEAGLPLHGHELGEGITPLQVGLGWVVAWNKPSFIGREALVSERERTVTRHLVGIKLDGRRPPREHCNVLSDGRLIGQTTSGNYSPVLQCGIALAFVEPNIGLGASVAINVRGTMLDGTVVQLPFVTTSRA